MTITWMELKDLRALLGLTQADLAEAIGVHQKTIVNWEGAGVPPRSEYKIRRVFGDELSYLEGVANGHIGDGTSVDDWKAQMAFDRAVWDSLAHDRSPEADRWMQLMQEETDALAEAAIEERQAEYEARAARLASLAPFSSVELLEEVKRRLLQHDSVPNVGSPIDTAALHDIDLRQSGLDLAATTDTSSVEEQSHPEYEDENQDHPENE